MARSALPKVQSDAEQAAGPSRARPARATRPQATMEAKKPVAVKVEASEDGQRKPKTRCRAHKYEREKRRRDVVSQQFDQIARLLNMNAQQVERTKILERLLEEVLRRNAAEEAAAAAAAAADAAGHGQGMVATSGPPPHHGSLRLAPAHYGAGQFYAEIEAKDE